jgi:hypothetical protein
MHLTLSICFPHVHLQCPIPIRNPHTIVIALKCIPRRQNLKQTIRIPNPKRLITRRTPYKPQGDTSGNSNRFSADSGEEEKVAFKSKKKMMMTAVYGMQQCGVPRRLDDDHNAFADSHVRNQHSGVLVGFEKTGIRRQRLTANI